MRSPRIEGRRGFTLVELLVVIVIVALISVAALPVVLPALNERRVSEGARLFQAVLSGARDAAIRANAPRGIRLLPDPILNPYGPLGLGVLASNRFVPIEPAPDYSEGLLSAIHSPLNNNEFLTVGELVASSGIPAVPNPPAAWFNNIRQGDRIRFGTSGAYYTIAGPMYTGPGANLATGNAVNFLQNPERFINMTRPPGGNFPAYPSNAFSNFPSNTYQYTPNGNTANFGQFLFLVNGVDDDGDGWIDEGFDGIDNDGDGVTDPGFNGLDDNNNGMIDEPAELTFTRLGVGGGEYEQETFLGAQTSTTLQNVSYTILRRPVVSPGTREVTLPDGIVIDLTTWNAAAATPTGAGVAGFVQPILPERSRVPVDPYAFYVDIMIAPSGQVVQAGAGSTGADTGGANGSPTANLPFYHFWLTERQGVVAPLWDSPTYTPTGPYVPALNPNYGSATNLQTYLLPMPKGTLNYAPPDNANGGPAYTKSPPYLLGERRLVTLFVKSGQIVTNSIEYFNPADTGRPFYDAQAGIKEQQ